METEFIRKSSLVQFYLRSFCKTVVLSILAFTNSDVLWFSLEDIKTDGKASPTADVPAQISDGIQAAVTKKPQKTEHMVSCWIFSFLYVF